MEYLAKITHEYNFRNLWKYNFIDIQTNRQNFFHHQKKIDYVPNLVGKLSLYEDKSFKSFEQGLDNTIERLEIEGETERNIEKALNHFNKKKIRLVFDFKHLHRLHNQGYTWKEVAKIYEKHEQSVYYWLRTQDKVLQQRGTKSRIDDKTASLICDYALKNNTKTQQEIADYVSKELNIPISRPSICVLLKKLGITRKKLTYHYNQLDEEKAKAFNEEIKPLLLDNVPFIALDECSFYPNLDPKFGYSLKGDRAIAKRPSYKGKHYTLLFAIGNLKEKGVICWKLTGEKVDWKTFHDFLEEINPIGDKKNILLMDNARIHKAPKQTSRGKVA